MLGRCATLVASAFALNVRAGLDADTISYVAVRRFEETGSRGRWGTIAVASQASTPYRIGASG